MEIPGCPGYHVEALAGGSPRVRQRVAGFLVRWGHYAEARPLLESLAAEQPDGILYRVWLGQCLLGLGLTDAASPVIEAVHADQPDSILAQAVTIDLLLASGRFGEAFGACQELFRPPTPKLTFAWGKLAAYYLARGEAPQARACAERAQALRRERAKDDAELRVSGPFLRLLGRIHAACGDETAASEAMRACAAREAEDAAVIRVLLEGSDTRSNGREGDGGRAGARKQGSKGGAALAPAPLLPRSPGPVTSQPAGPSSAPLRPQSPVLPTSAADALRGRLQSVFGYHDWLPGQRETIEGVMTGRDVLATLPTGGGKSLCYQLPALALPKAVVVISPLIALMRDQVENLPSALAARATLINSSVDSREIERRLEGIAAGRLKLVYAAPERLRQWPFLHALRRAGVSLFVVDEAHCISLWGHDFRPDYFFIGPALVHLGQPPLLALTATATPQVQREIGERLGRRLERVNAGIARPNLRLEGIRCADEDDKVGHLLRLVMETEGPAIVYARAREKCEALAGVLRRNGVSAIHYHAGMETGEREEAQTQFMQGRARVVCATVAFGMGIDQADIRLIVHVNLPKSVESYWQEAGRAGRDGLPARCALLATAREPRVLTHWMQQEAIGLPLLRKLYHAARDFLGGPGPGRVVWDDLAREVESDETRIRVSVGLLERAGLLHRLPDFPRTLSVCPLAPGDSAYSSFIARARLRPGQRLDVDALDLCARTGIPPADLEPRLLAWRDAGWLSVRLSGRDGMLLLPEPPVDAWVCLEELLWNYEGWQAQRVEQIAAYARTRECRHHFIAGIFGEGAPDRCCSCDNCVPVRPAMPTSVPLSASPLAPGPGRTALVQRLRAWRLESARAEGIPAFCVLHNTVLDEIARVRPKSIQALEGVRGMGPRKCARYGEEILDVLRTGNQ